MVDGRAVLATESWPHAPGAGSEDAYIAARLRPNYGGYGNDPLPTGAEALDEPLRAFPSWFLRIVCGRWGKVRMISETHMAQGEMLIRDIVDRPDAPRRLRRHCREGW